MEVKGRFGPSKSNRFAIFILLNLLIKKDIRGYNYYPVNESHPFDEKTRSCYHSGDYESFKRKLPRCHHMYGKLIMNDVWSPSLFLPQLTGCIIFNSLPSLRRIIAVYPILQMDTKFCEYEYALIIYGNPNLTRIFFKKEQILLKTPISIPFGTVRVVVCRVRAKRIELDVRAFGSEVVSVRDKETFIRANRHLEKMGLQIKGGHVDIGTNEGLTDLHVDITM
ncbi:hypothetical protein GCK32_006559 [Trichostrongylus colubriformis]|uniref:Uncharacterized protein n=1 Tax=Trichostrongylus colubriformis TaxID=6319 RepID=A0AAN8FT94_TRICO